MSESPELPPAGLLTLLYSVLDDRNQWPVFLQEFGEYVGVTYASLMSWHFGPGGAPPMLKMFKWGMSDEDAQEYYTRWAVKDPWVTNADLSLYPPGTVVYSDDICPDEILEGSEAYQCFLKSRNLHYGGSVVLDLSERICTALATLRAKERGRLKEEELGRIRCMAPHLRRVVRLQDRLDELQTSCDLLRGMFNQTATGIALLDKSGAVLAANTRATAIIKRGALLWLDQGQMRARDREEDKKLQEAIRRSVDRFDASQIAGNTGEEIVLLRGSDPGGTSHPMRILIVPTEREQTLTPSSRTAAATVHMIDFAASPQVDKQLLRRLLSLSKAEAEVAAHLASGLNASEVADQLHVSLHTVRSHLKNLFRKTGTTQQSALVSLILRFQPQFRARIARTAGAPAAE